MFSPFHFNPMDNKSVAEQVEYVSGANSNIVSSIIVNFESYYKGIDWKPMYEDYIAAEPSRQKEMLAEISKSALEDVLVLAEGFNEKQAESIVAKLYGNDQSKAEATLEITSPETFSKVIITTAKQMYMNVSRQLAVASMELHLMDYQSIFPQRSCLHDHSMVLRRLHDPSYIPTIEERKAFFRNHSDLSFPILNSMAAWDVFDTVDADMQVLQSATRYQLLKRVFDEIKEEPPGEVAVSLSSGDADEKAR